MKKTMKYTLLRILIFLQLMTLNLSSNSINDIRQKLINVTAEILKIEHEIIVMDNNELEIFKSEANALSEFFNQLQVGNLMQNIRHVQSASPLLMAMAMDSTDDLVQSIMLLQALAKQINTKHTKLLEHIKIIGKSHLNIKKKVELNLEQREKIRLLSIEQENLLNEKYHLFFKNSSNPNLEYKEETSQQFDDLVHQLQTLFHTSHSKSSSHIKLMIPVNGFLKENDNKHLVNVAANHKQDLSASFETYGDAQVISPMEGKVAFAGFVPSFGHVVILKQDEFFCVIIGLGSVHCFLGDTLLPGEPIGRMPFENETTKTFKLRFELHKGPQHLDPRPYFIM